MLVEKAIRVERVRTGDAAAMEDAAKFADVLLATKADATAAGVGRSGAGVTVRGTGAQERHEEDASHG